MCKKILLCFMLFSLLGCASKPVSKGPNTKERLLLQTGDYQKLISFYKARLIENPDPETRLKLADAYLRTGDPESALFTSSPLLALKDKNADLYIIQAYSYYELGNIGKALENAQIANELERNNPDTENLLGLIAVAAKDYKTARHYFNLSRSHFYDDIKIKNNLAALDIVEGDYQHAVQLLLPMYLNNNHDEQLKANLLMALAKYGDYSFMQSILANEYSEDEIEEMYYALRNTETHANTVAVAEPIEPIRVTESPIVDPTEAVQLAASDVITLPRPLAESTEPLRVTESIAIIESAEPAQVVTLIEPVKSTKHAYLSTEEYGPVKVDETLWSISLSLRPDHSVSVLQTMTAIYKKNQHAFLKGNINKIIPTSMLNVPLLTFIQQQTYQEAMNLIDKYSVKKKKAVKIKTARITTKKVEQNINLVRVLSSDLERQNEGLL